MKTFQDFSIKQTLNHLVPIEVHYMEKNAGIFSSKTLISFRLKKERKTWISWMTWGVSKLSANVVFFFLSELLL